MTGPLGEGDQRHAQAVEAARRAYRAAVIGKTAGRLSDMTDSFLEGLAAYHDSLRAQGVVLVEAATNPRTHELLCPHCGCVFEMPERDVHGVSINMGAAATKPCDEEPK